MSATLPRVRPVDPGLLTLVLLVGMDLVYLVVDVSHNILGVASPRSSFEVHRDRSIPEFYQYTKLLWILGVITVLAWSVRQSNLLVWTPFFGFLLATDALTLHEMAGGWLATQLSLPPVLGLRPRDLGEAIVAGSLTVVTLAGVLVTWRRSGAGVRSVHLGLGRLVVALGLFGLVADLLTSALSGRAGVLAVASRVEDGGEMVVVSAILAFLVTVFCRRVEMVAVPRDLIPPRVQ